jgi:hypothetical protein
MAKEFLIFVKYVLFVLVFCVSCNTILALIEKFSINQSRFHRVQYCLATLLDLPVRAVCSVQWKLCL